MAEKRKPELTILLKSPGKRKMNKIELFSADLWIGRKYGRGKLYRLRVNGRWNDKTHEGNMKYLTKWQFRDLLFRTLRI